jgi:hypothetical protein
MFSNDPLSLPFQSCQPRAVISRFVPNAEALLEQADNPQHPLTIGSHEPTNTLLRDNTVFTNLVVFYLRSEFGKHKLGQRSPIATSSRSFTKTNPPQPTTEQTDESGAINQKQGSQSRVAPEYHHYFGR